ncbi:MAG: hypothetical protein IT464_03350, partial [Planctomycetes bacterium]|nr:hypothetical protein [Planctomycetota bacterium]
MTGAIGRVRRLQRLVNYALVLLAFVAPAALGAQSVLWYAGDFNSVNGYQNGFNFAGPPDGRQFCDFVIPTGETWTITQAFSDNLANVASGITSADYQIRTGMAAGNLGTLVSSGTFTATWTTTGRSAFGYTEYRIDGTLSSSVILSAGTYWINVRPRNSVATGSCFKSTTSGTNGVGALNNNNSLSSYNGAAPTANANDFVCGVRGTKGPGLTVAAVAGTAQNVYANDTGSGGNGIVAGRFTVASNSQTGASLN